MARPLTLALAVAGVVIVGATVVVVTDDDGSEGPAAATSTTTTAPLVGTPGAPGVGDPYFPALGNGGYDVEHYDLDLRWSADEGALAGVTTITATATQDLSRFNLDLAGMEVRSVTVDGRAAASRREDRELVVTPRVTLASGRPFTTVVTYDGIPTPISQGTDLFDVGWQTDGREAFVICEPSGAATFFPVNDHPVDKATYTINVTAPQDQVVAANGLLVRNTFGGPGNRTWTYEARDPMASYLVQIAIGDYELVDGGRIGDVVVRHAFHRSVVREATSATALTAEMLLVLADIFGPYPFEAYGVVAVDEPLGFALETQTLTLIGSDIAKAGSGDPIMLHELAHQWVGDAVSPATWQDIWLNEGFATYAEWLWSERMGGTSAHDIARRQARDGDLDTPAGDPGAAELFSATVYARGALTLQALREAIGDPAFFELTRTWVAEHSGGVASTADLIELAERLSGQQLDDLFDRWLRAPELPSL